ncbi:MAG: FAD-dependent oxidoreductase [Actinomycetota bacterium]
MVDTAIVGAGVIGLACARELANAGATVTVLEAADVIGQGSSARANGGVRAQFSTATNIAFSRFSIEAFETLEETTGTLGLHQTGYLLVTGNDMSERSLRAAADLQRSLGVDTEWLSPDQIAERLPFLRTDGLRAGTFHARDGFLDPASVVATFARDALTTGASILTGARVQAIRRTRSGFRIEHARGSLAADFVVNAAGSDAHSTAALLGSDLPVSPVRRNLAHVLEQGGPHALTPMVVDLDTGVLVRREPAGGWIVGYANPADAPGRETHVDPRFFEDLSDRLPNRFPFLLDLPMDPGRCWAGLYPETPDHHAIVGEDPHVSGLFHCAGFGGHGVMHAPAAGRAIRELIVGGECSTFDLRPLRPARFADGDLVVETAVF